MGCSARGVAAWLGECGVELRIWGSFIWGGGGWSAVGEAHGGGWVFLNFGQFACLRLWTVWVYLVWWVCAREMQGKVLAGGGGRAGEDLWA
jgi:hypothetical protein